jgi:hypothetical protein
VAEVRALFYTPSIPLKTYAVLTAQEPGRAPGPVFALQRDETLYPFREANPNIRTPAVHSLLAVVAVISTPLCEDYATTLCGLVVRVPGC